MSKLSRLLVLLASMLVLIALATPLWRIRLLAPQYPEGLGMDIHAGRVVGAREHDLQSINSLNHYIGMKAIEPEEIAELRIIPWCIAGLALLGFVAAATGRRWMAIGWLAAFAVFGVVALSDFYHWEYEYGHDLDQVHAIIKVPGMTYQPPLIGSKQLLNFTAISWPTTGAILIGVAFVIGCVSVYMARPHAASPVEAAA
jgi:copper chaperone NosL